MNTKIAIATALMSGCLVSASVARADDSFLGAIIGGGAGALVGKSIGGRDGAIIGGVLGGAAGVAIADQRRARFNYAPQPVHYRQPALIVPAPVYYVRGDRYWTGHRGHEWEHRRCEHEREHHEIRYDRDHGRGWDREGSITPVRRRYSR